MSDEQKPEIVSPAVAEARERRAAAEAELAEKRKAEKAAEDEQREIDEAALAVATLKYGELGDGIAKVGTRAGMVIVRRPTEARWQQVQRDAESRDPARLAEHGKRLILDHLVHPNDSAYFKISERYPDLPTTLIGMIHGLARGGARALSGE